MIIREIYLKNFGKFSGKKIQFSDGLNIIYGPNEAGKTTIYHSIGALLFGLEKQRGRGAKSDTYTTYQPWEHKTWYEGSMKFETGGKIFCVERNFYHNEKSVRLFCETDGEELSIEDGDLEMLLGDTGAELYFNTAAVGQLKMKPQDIVYSYLKNYIAGMQEAGKNATDVVKAIQILENKKKELEKERKKQTSEFLKQIAVLDAGLEFVEKEMTDCAKQLESLMANRMREQKGMQPEKKQGIFKRFLHWLKKIFCGKRMKEAALQKEENIWKLEEKMRFLQELLGEKEIQKEELLLEKDAVYEKLHAQSKDEEIQALELAMDRIRELSALGKEEVFKQLMDKTSLVLRQMTKGKYEKLILQEGQEPVLWDGEKTVKLFQLSAGCVDQVYLSLRIGLQDLFFREETLPLMFDDAFVYFDDQRLERLLIFLSSLGRQVLLFSCHKRELRILEQQQIPYMKILL